MRVAEALDAMAELPEPVELSRFAAGIDPDWVAAALEATGKASMRRRRLPAEQAVWLVIGMALFRNRPIWEVVDKLELALEDVAKPLVAKSASAHARKRLGAEPVRWLFQHSAQHWSHPAASDDRFRGLALYGMDGTTFRVPDSDANREHFGLASGGDRGTSGYPLVRMVALMALRSHLLVDAAFGPYGNGEYHYAQSLWEQVPDDSLCIVDRNFWSAALLHKMNSCGNNRHWLIRAKITTNGRCIEAFGPGDALVELKVSPQARRKDPSLPKKWTVRILDYQLGDHPPQRLITSLVDSKEYPAEELIAIYHERWECELGYDELKTEMLQQTRQPLRSQTPEAVEQELWGVLLAYNLVRLEMKGAAEAAGVPPTRISFVSVYRMICDEWRWSDGAAPGAIPKRLQQLREQVQRFVLPPRRRQRSFPRAVKIKMSNYPKKQRPLQPDLAQRDSAESSTAAK